jgi:ArsR family transcriptional regulator
MGKNYMEYNETAGMLKILAHPVGLCIINLLRREGSCNVSHMQDCIGIPQSTLSQHLQKLRMAKIIKSKRNGLEINYSICVDKVRELVKFSFKTKV